MTDAPEKIWAYPTQSKSRIGIWRSDDDLAVSTEYTRSDIAQARISELEDALQSILMIPNSPSAQGIMKVFAESALMGEIE
tara:strand:+ start:1764 stop:2006 length:243 start_codon:yes stop_codon:yes gene_type:complete